MKSIALDPAPKTWATHQKTKNCITCGNQFATQSGKKVYCSRACLSKHHDTKRTEARRAALGINTAHTCLICSAEYTRKSTVQKYCTPKCKDIANDLQRVEARRAELGIPDVASCVSCTKTYRPWAANQTTCGDNKCKDALTVAKRMKPCLGCGVAGVYAGRTQNPGYCRDCKPVARRSAVAIAIANGDYPAIHAALKERSAIDPDTGCWVWQHSKTQGGYGCVGGVEVQADGTQVSKQYMAHRLSLEVKMGRPLGAHQAHHTCANRACCNPAHLQPVTSAENVGEMRARKSYEARIAELEAALAEYDPSHPLIAG